MKFGITLPNYGKYAGKNEIVEIAHKAEELGYDSLWVSDHVIIPYSHQGFGNVFYDPYITLTFIASSTQKIKLGTSVAILPYRNPVVFAKMTSTLDNLSGGRLILGVGAGWLKEEFEALGVHFESRGKITDEILKILKILWNEDDPKYEGKYYNFSDIKFLPKPEQKPHPPILIGGDSDKSIERAVKCGDGWHPVNLTPEQLKEKLPRLKNLLKKYKKENFKIWLRRTVEITDKDLSEEETLRGSTEKIIAGIKSYKSLGVNHLILHFLSGTMDGVLDSMTRFAKKIKPNI